MSFFPLQFQILSDLHLETPIVSPSYTHFSQPSRIPLEASNLLLLGDIGLLSHAQLSTFLRSLLSQRLDLRVFYILGNHEFYGLTIEQGVHKTTKLKEELKEFETRFHILEKTAIDINENVTLLGCTLWSYITPSQTAECISRLTDFNPERGIRDRTVESHNEDHINSLQWLNDQVERIEKESPSRQIIIVTHHCPTLDPRALDPRHRDSAVSSGFATDLSKERCWMSPRVRVWGFGHTHFSCAFVDGEEEGGKGKLVVSCQKGYAGLGGKGRWKVRSCVIEEGDGGDWNVVDGKEARGEEEVGDVVGEENVGVDVDDGLGDKGKERKGKMGFLSKVGKVLLRQ